MQKNKSNLKVCVILAGGMGTRLANLTKAIPKPMILINNKPLLEYQIELLKKYSVTEIILCTYYLAEVISSYFGDGSKFGVNIKYVKEETPLGTSGCIKELEDMLPDEFMVLYGDVIVNMKLDKFFKFHEDHKGIATLVVHPNTHPYDSDLIEIDENNRITNFLSKPHPKGMIYSNLTNAGVYILSKRCLNYITKGVKSDFGKDVFPKMVITERSYVYNTPEYLKDMGTPERLKMVVNDVKSGKFENFNMKNKRPAIFLDRDGVINKEVDQLHKLDDFELLPNVAEAIKKINDSKYMCVVITNQPAVARGLCSISDIELIHKKMETLLGEKGAKLDAIYYCPHHPDKGYPNENPKYKIECECRKPKTGLIKRAEKDLNIDLSSSYIVGDSTRDVMTGRNASIKTIGVRTGYACKDNAFEVRPDLIFENLYDAVKFIIDKK